MRKTHVLAALLLPVAAVAGTFTVIDYPGATSTIAQGINNAGVIVGEWGLASGSTHGFAYSRGKFTDLFPSGYDSAQAWGVNDEGDIVGDARHAVSPPQLPPTDGFIRGEFGKFTKVDYPAATMVETILTGINDSEQIVGVWTEPSAQYFFLDHGFVLSHGKYTDIVPPGTNHTVDPQGINNNGDIVGFTVSAALPVSFLRTAWGKYQTIAYPGALYTVASGINDLGEIVGVYGDSNFQSHGFVYSFGKYTSIDVPGAAPNTASFNGINNAGVIVGSFADKNNVTHGFVMTR